MRYGMPYMGSKNIIAEDIIHFLPKGKRLVDLFGGGGAIAHCALLSNKWQDVLYNELNPLVCDVLKRAINGEFSYDKFKPEFITREKFNELKESEGYIKLCWSFGNGGISYLYNAKTEKLKKVIHDAIVFDKITKEFLEIYPNFKKWEIDDIKQRRLFLKKLNRELKIRIDLQSLESLERLQISNKCYQDYQYKDGDVVYCDPPYEGTRGYSKKGFNHTEFYEWVATRPYQVFFSSYEISDKRFFTVWDKEKISLFDFRKNKKIIEKIYSNICIEKNEAYHKASIARLNAARAQMRMEF